MLPRRKPSKSGIRDDDGPIRSEAARQWVRGFVCVCFKIGQCEGRIEAAHYRTAANSGTGSKPSDEWLFPACHRHHAEQHQIGQQAFEARYFLNLKRECERIAKLNPAIIKAMRERGQ